MLLLKSAKIYLLFAVLVFVAKPFLGFSMFSRLHPPAADNIFVKAFTKRKHEYTEHSSYDIIAIQKKLANPLKELFLHFTAFLNVLFPLKFASDFNIPNSFLQTSVQPIKRSYLRNSKLII